jgi:predicted SAM-dependent methyltransferase
MFRLAPLATRWRGRVELSEYTGGWNAPFAAPQSSQCRLNLGCGQANYEGYINLDVVPWPHLNTRALGQRLPFRSESCDEVLCTDVIEHLDAEDGLRLLEEASRVLRRHGRLILVTPDLDNIVRAYVSRFGTHNQVVQHLLGDARDHRYLYTVPLLKERLNRTGLIVQRCIRHWGPIWAHMVLLAEKA